MGSEARQTHRPEIRILVVEDDEATRKAVEAALDQEPGWVVSGFGTAEEAWAWLDAEGWPDLAILDLLLPQASGLEMARRIKASSDVPLLMLSSVDDEEVIIQTLDELAEDYVLKPFNPRELFVRARRILRRMGDFSSRSEPMLRLGGGLEVNLSQRQLRNGDTSVQLTPTEAKILHILMRSPGRSVTTTYLLRRVWPLEDIYEDTLRVHVHRLRKKLEEDPRKPQRLLTDRGVGYRLEVPEELRASLSDGA